MRPELPVTATHSATPGAHTEDTECSPLLLTKGEKKEQNYGAEIPRATLPGVRKKQSQGWKRSEGHRGAFGCRAGRGLGSCLKSSDSSGVHTLARCAMTID